MTIHMATDAEVRQEVAQLLLQYLAPAKLTRFWASWQMGQGDYLAWREEIFAHETVDTLYEKILTFQEESPQTN